MAVATADEAVENSVDLSKWGRFSEAELLLTKARQKYPEDFSLRLEEIRISLMQDNLHPAHDQIDAATDIWPDNPILAHYQGVWFLLHGDYARSKATLEWAADRLPADSYVQCNLAAACRNLDQISEAEIHARPSIIFRYP